MDNKKSTVLLTVVAVATLLVAVVGSTFAFFAIQATNNAKVEVTTKTASGSDVFNTTGAGVLSLDVTNDTMMQANASADNTTVADEDEDSEMQISLKAGSGIATCTYNLVWKETEVDPEAENPYVPYAKTKVNTGTTEAPVMTPVEANEYTIQGTDGTQKFDEVNMDAIENNVLGTFEIVNNAEDDAATVQTWTFKTIFYNLPVDQGVQMDKTYSGTVVVDGISCSNEAA